MVPEAGATKTSVWSSQERFGWVPCIPPGRASVVTSVVPVPSQTANEVSGRVLVPIIIGGIMGGIPMVLNTVATIRLWSCVKVWNPGLTLPRRSPCAWGPSP